MKAGLGAKVGSEYFIEVKVRGGGKAELKITGEFECSHDGLFLSPKVDASGLTAFVEAEFTAFKMYSKKKEREWQLVEPKTLYPPEDKPWEPFQLLPRKRK